LSDVLADTSIWIAHFRGADPVLQRLLQSDRVLIHPLIVLELACGTPPSPRERTLGNLRKLRRCTVATDEEILALVEREQLFDSGCGAVDVALLASALLTPGTRLWTSDKSLGDLARGLGVAFTDDST
jgi:predicted nucleic acid-binding protein